MKELRMRASKSVLGLVCLGLAALFVVTPSFRNQTAHAQNSTNADGLIAASPTSGKLVFNFTVTVNSAIPKSGVIACEAHADLNDSGRLISEKAFTLAHLVSGSTWACSTAIPYSWTLASASTDKVALSYKLTIVEALQLNAANTGAATVLAPIGTREDDEGIEQISIPLSGATTTIPVAARL
jgi:hypothetical protein